MLSFDGIGVTSILPNGVRRSEASYLPNGSHRRVKMRVAVYVRVSTQHQVQTQTIEQQLDRLQEHSQSQGWPWRDEHVFRDDGYSGASLRRASPGSLA